MENFSSYINGLEEDDLVYLDCYLDSVYNGSPDFPDLTCGWSPLSQELNEYPTEDSLDILPSLQPVQSDIDNNEEHHDGGSVQDPRPVRKNKGIPSERFVSYKSFPSVRSKPYPCKFCGINLSTKESSKRHILSKHVKERPHLCNVCGKAFVFKFSLKAHSAIHEDTPRHVCICGESFKLRSSYMSHVRRIHQAVSEIKFSCELCFKSFRDRHTLRLHMTSVHDPKTIPCKAKGCKKVFSSISLMRCHYRYHLNKKFTCDKCGQSFSTESYLQKHVLSHSGVRPYCCVDCGKSFLSVSHLNQHHRICHSPVKSYQCSFCGKCFKTKDLLKYHESNHRGEKPFKCEVCGYATAYRNTYYAHRKRHFIAKESSETHKNEALDNKNKCKKNIYIKQKLKCRKSPQIFSSLSMHEQSPNASSSKTCATSPLSPSSSSLLSFSPSPMYLAKPVNMNFLVFPQNVLNELSKGESEPNLCDTVLKSPDSDSNFLMVKDNLTTDGQHVKDSNCLYFKENASKQVVSEKGDCAIILSNNGRCSILECKSLDDSLLLIKIGDNSFAGVCSNHAVLDVEASELNLNPVENLTLTAIDSKCLRSDPTAENAPSISSPPVSDNLEEDFMTTLGDDKLLMVSPGKNDLISDNSSIDQSVTLTECNQSDMTSDMLLPLSQLENAKSSSGISGNEPEAEIDDGMPSLSNHIDDSFHLAHMEIVCRVCDEQFFCMDTYITHLECSHK